MKVPGYVLTFRSAFAGSSCRGLRGCFARQLQGDRRPPALAGLAEGPIQRQFPAT